MSIIKRVNPTRFQREMSAEAWNGYMAGTYAASRDEAMRRARAATDPEVRGMFARHARESHRWYLKSASAAIRRTTYGEKARKAMLARIGANL